jgi:hypothetical protein
VVVNRPGAAVFPGSTGVGSVLMFSRRCLDYRTTRTACLLAFCAWGPAMRLACLLLSVARVPRHGPPRA